MRFLISLARRGSIVRSNPTPAESLCDCYQRKRAVVEEEVRRGRRRGKEEIKDEPN
jgi:hypothetical protein